APLGELKVYMVTEEELDTLGRGSPGSVFLNFALALLPLSVAFLVTLLTTSISSVVGLVFFVCACLICFITGLICLVLAWQNHISTRAVVDKIKNRMPPAPPISQEAPAPGTGGETARVAKPPEAPQPPPPATPGGPA